MKLTENNMKFSIMLDAFIADTKKQFGREPNAKEIQILVKVLKEMGIELPLEGKK